MNIFAGAGFAVMAWREAQRRKGRDDGGGPAKRNGFCGVDVHPEIFPVSTEFYAITDRATAHWQATSLADINTRCVL